MRDILILGASSAIAQACCRLFAEAGDRLTLVARDADKLTIVAEEAKVYGAAKIRCIVADLSDLEKQSSLVEDLYSKTESFDIVLLAYGSLAEQIECQNDATLAEAELRTNFVSPALLLNSIAARFEKQASGTIAVITSVAGDRGRQSNYIYGAAKGGLSIYLQGLRNRLAKSGVNVLTIKPGFVDTPMTAHIKKGPLFAKPETIAEGILKAISAKKSIVYLPWFWRGIMLIIKVIPESIFKKLSL